MHLYQIYYKKETDATPLVIASISVQIIQEEIL